MYSNENPPNQSDYISAVSELKEKFDDQQLTAIRAQYSNPGRAITAQELTEALKYKDIGGANLVYGFLGKLVAEKSDLVSKIGRKDVPDGGDLFQ